MTAFGHMTLGGQVLLLPSRPAPISDAAPRAPLTGLSDTVPGRRFRR